MYLSFEQLLFPSMELVDSALCQDGRVVCSLEQVLQGLGGLRSLRPAAELGSRKRLDPKVLCTVLRAIFLHVIRLNAAEESEPLHSRRGRQGVDSKRSSEKGNAGVRKGIHDALMGDRARNLRDRVEPWLGLWAQKSGANRWTNKGSAQRMKFVWA